MGSGARQGGMSGAVPPGGIASMMGQMSPGMGGMLPGMGGLFLGPNAPLRPQSQQPQQQPRPVVFGQDRPFSPQPGMRVGQTGMMPPNAQGQGQGLQALLGGMGKTSGMMGGIR